MEINIKNQSHYFYNDNFHAKLSKIHKKLCICIDIDYMMIVKKLTV